MTAAKKGAAKKGAAKKAAAKKAAAKKGAAGKRGAGTRAASKRGTKAAGTGTTTRAGRRPRARSADAERRGGERGVRSPRGSRYLVHYDVDGPRVRLGIAWFLGALLAFALGVVAVALYFGLAFAAATSQVLRAWRVRGAPVDPRVGLLAVAAVVAGAAVHPRVMGVALLAVVAGVVARSARHQGADLRPAVAEASLTLQAVVPLAVAGGCLVLLSELEAWAAVALVLLVSAYETGDFLIGSGAARPVEGPVAGCLAVVVTALAVAAVGFPPFDIGEAVVFGVLVAPLAFAGQLLASAVLPHARSFAPALRRVDSLLLAAPLWYLGVDALVA